MKFFKRFLSFNRKPPYTYGMLDEPGRPLTHNVRRDDYSGGLQLDLGRGRWGDLHPDRQVWFVPYPTEERVRLCYTRSGSPELCWRCGGAAFDTKTTSELDVGVGPGVLMEVEYFCASCGVSVAYWAYGAFDPTWVTLNTGVRYDFSRREIHKQLKNS